MFVKINGANVDANRLIFMTGVSRANVTFNPPIGVNAVDNMNVAGIIIMVEQ
jgi:hypothetical protein